MQWQSKLLLFLVWDMQNKDLIVLYIVYTSNKGVLSVLVFLPQPQIKSSSWEGMDNANKKCFLYLTALNFHLIVESTTDCRFTFCLTSYFKSGSAASVCGHHCR